MVLQLSMKMYSFFEVHNQFRVKCHEVYNLPQQKITDGANTAKYESCLSLGDVNEGYEKLYSNFIILLLDSNLRNNQK